MKKAIFLDKDGTLIENISANINPDYIRLKKKTIEGLRTFQEFGFLLIIVTNQGGVAQALFKEESLIIVRNTLSSILETEGVILDDFYYCPHDINGIVNKYAVKCNCRKPEPGMILKAAHKYQIDLFHSWMIGDTLNDVEAGNRAGCNTILVANGNETQLFEENYRQPLYIANNINDAANQIIRRNFLNSFYE